MVDHAASALAKVCVTRMLTHDLFVIAITFSSWHRPSSDEHSRVHSPLHA